MIHKACMPVYMNSGKIVADGWTGRDGWRIEGSTRGPRGPKNGGSKVKVSYCCLVIYELNISQHFQLVLTIVIFCWKFQP